jgi:hypothetical protein
MLDAMDLETDTTHAPATAAAPAPAAEPAEKPDDDSDDDSDDAPDNERGAGRIVAFAKRDHE